MASYKIQLKDENGNRQYPVSTTNIVVDADGVSVADLLDRKQNVLASGVNIKTINGKSILGSGDLVIGEGGGSSSEGVETRVLYCYIENGIELTEEEKAYNKETYDKIANGEDIQLVLNAIGLPVTHAYYEGDILFSASVYLDGVLVYGQGNLFSDGNTYYEENQIGGTGGEAVESDVISVVYDDDQLITLSNVEAFNKLAECCETVGKPVAVMVCIESGYRWGIEHFYWSKKDEEIELVSPIRKDGMYATFYLTKDGSCTATFGQVSLGGGLKYFVERYVYEGNTEEERTYNLESLAMAEQGVDILWAGMQGMQMTGIPGEWWVRLESEAFVTILSASMSIDNGTLSWNMTSFCRQFAYRNSEFRPYIKAFFDNSNWIYESACYGACPIISWEDSGGTSVRAYYFKNNMKPYYVEINADTGEVGEETLVTQS